MKGDMAEDPRGLIYEAYRIDGIGAQECRTIFLDWALGLPADQDAGAWIKALADRYAPEHPEHPMTQVLMEGLTRSAKPARRRGRAGRL